MNRSQFFTQQSIRDLPAKEKNARWAKYSRKQIVLKQRGLNVQVTQPKARITNKPMKLSQCMLNYARASIDPFDNSLKEVCIPDNHAVRSQKVSAYINSQLIIGTNGIGIAALNPWSLLVGDVGRSASAANYPLVVTTATYSSTTIDIDMANLDAGHLSGYDSNSPLTYNAYGRHSMRVVSAAVEVFYTGTTLSQAGAISTLQVDGLASLNAGTTITAFRNDPRSVTCSVAKGSRCYCSYYPVRDDNLSYLPLDNYLPTLFDTPPASGFLNPLIIIITGATPGTTFQVKAIAHYECLFPGGGATKSDSDPIAFSAFQVARTELVPTPDPSQDLSKVLRSTFRNIAASLSPYLPMLGTAIGTAAGNASIGSNLGSAGKSMLDYMLDGDSVSI